MQVRRVGQVTVAALALAAAASCGGLAAGTVQVTNDGSPTVTVMECPPSTTAGPGCPGAIGRVTLSRGHSTKFAPVTCRSRPCQPTELVAIATDGTVQCSVVPPSDGKHSVLFLVTTLPGTGCDKYVKPTPAG